MKEAVRTLPFLSSTLLMPDVHRIFPHIAVLQLLGQQLSVPQFNSNLTPKTWG